MMAAEQFTIERLEINETEIKGAVFIQADLGPLRGLNAGASEGAADPAAAADGTARADDGG